MRQIVTSTDMKRLDELTTRTMGIPSMVLMERASMSFVDALLESDADLRRILVVCGSGNNGGDGFAIARLLHMKGLPVEVLFAGKEDHLTEEARQQKRIAANYRVPEIPYALKEKIEAAIAAEQKSPTSNVQTEESKRLAGENQGPTSDVQTEEGKQSAGENQGLTSDVQTKDKEQTAAEDLTLTADRQTKDKEQTAAEDLDLFSDAQTTYKNRSAADVPSWMWEEQEEDKGQSAGEEDLSEIPDLRLEKGGQSRTEEDQTWISDLQLEKGGQSRTGEDQAGIPDLELEKDGQSKIEAEPSQASDVQAENQSQDLAAQVDVQPEESGKSTTEEGLSQSADGQKNVESAGDGKSADHQDTSDEGYDREEDEEDEADDEADDSALYVKDAVSQGTASAGSTVADSRVASISRTISTSIERLDFSQYSVIVDALFGIGLSGSVREPYAEIIRAINRSGAFVASVDIPSGLSGDTGRVQGAAVRADLTVTFACLKRGQVLYPGADYCGELVVKDIGIYGKSVNSIYSLTENDLLFLSQRDESANKGTFGKVLAVAGSFRMSGAACLSTQAILTAGAGMVMVQTVKENRLPIQTLVPEAVVVIGDDQKLWRDAINWADVLLLGPGLGVGPSSLKRAEWFLTEAKYRNLPTVIDADGLNLLSMYPKLMDFLPANTILTPHMGEFSRLSSFNMDKIKRNPIEAAQEYVRKNAVTLVLKDARTVITGEGETYLNMRGNSGMATAGSGDVLAGLLAGLLASERDTYMGNRKSMSLTKLAASGVLLHSLAGEEAAKMHGKRSMTAGKILEGLEKEILRIE